MPQKSSTPTQTVKIVRFHSLGGPEVLQLDTLPLPEPGRGEVRLRVKAIGLNRAECMFRQGRYLVAPELPSKIGYEASGIVEAVGAGVDPTWLGRTASTPSGCWLADSGRYMAGAPGSASVPMPAGRP